eukprot:PITA_13069
MSQHFDLVMQKEFEMPFLGELTYFLGLQIQQNKDDIFLSQTKYLKQISKECGMEDSKLVCTPMVTGCNLSTNDESAAVHQPTYRSMIGSLIYLTETRPDIMHTVGIVGRFQANPKEAHLQAVKRIFKYLQGTQNYGLWYPRDANLTLHAYANADWAGSVDDRKSTRGGAFFMGPDTSAGAEVRRPDTGVGAEVRRPDTGAGAEVRKSQIVQVRRSTESTQWK